MFDLLTALALVLVVEGLCYALVPEGMRRMMVRALSLPAGRLRLYGLISMATGVAAVWLIRAGLPGAG